MGNETRTAPLVARAQAGDREAFDRLFALAAHKAQLYARLRLGSALRREVDSEDVLQEAYAEAVKAFDRFEYRGDGTFGRWLCRIVDNRIRALADHHGAQKRTPEGERARLSGVLNLVSGGGTRPVAAAQREETRERLAGALTRLEPEEREVLLLRFFEERTLDEIGARLGRGPGAARRALGRAMLRLGMLLKEVAP